MSKIACKCGRSITDQTDRIPNKGAIIRDQNKADLYDGMANDINSFIDALSQGKRVEWIHEYYLRFHPDDSPVEAIKNEDILSTILSRHIAKELCIYQCVSCGGLMIESEPFSNTFESFTADKWEEGKASILDAGKGEAGPKFRIL
jgi:hypothetical protein